MYHDKGLEIYQSREGELKSLAPENKLPSLERFASTTFMDLSAVENFQSQWLVHALIKRDTA